MHVYAQPLRRCVRQRGRDNSRRPSRPARRLNISKATAATSAPRALDTLSRCIFTISEYLLLTLFLSTCSRASIINLYFWGGGGASFSKGGINTGPVTVPQSLHAYSPTAITFAEWQWGRLGRGNAAPATPRLVIAHRSEARAQPPLRPLRGLPL